MFSFCCFLLNLNYNQHKCVSIGYDQILEQFCLTKRIQTPFQTSIMTFFVKRKSLTITVKKLHKSSLTKL